MTNIKLGCAGWDYKDWIGPFYPKNLKRLFFLQYYSSIFDIIEINSSFYNIPLEKSVKNWSLQVPSNFRFIVKVWKEITHKLDENGIDLKISNFFNRLKALKQKVWGYLFQFPPWFKHSIEHEVKIKVLLNQLPQFENENIIFEFRDNSWFEAQDFLYTIKNVGIIIATTYKPELKAYYLPNQEYYYIRLIGDRKLTIFNRIQRTQDKIVHNLLENIESMQKNPKIYQIFIIVNNHFAGFAPESVNLIKKDLNVPIRDFNFQKKLSDYF